MNGHVWSCMVMYDLVQSCMVMYGHEWSCMVIFGQIWSWNVINGYSWFCGGTYGILRSQEIWGVQKIQGINGKRRIIWNKAKIGEILNIRKILEITIKFGVKGIEGEKEYMENREFIKYREKEGKF